MAIYAIGDIQGCYNTFLRLLDKLHYDPNEDTLWLTGDLTNRGKHSLETLRFIKSLDIQPGRLVSVMGNHDLALLAVASGAYPYDTNHYTFKDILEAPDKPILLDWLRKRPFLHHDEALGLTLVHAGILPTWDLTEAKQHAAEVESVMQSNELSAFYPHLYGNEPTQWDPNLQGFERWRFIINSFCRMRFSTESSVLDFTTKESALKAPPGFMPWFKVPHRKMKEARGQKILFGHWASLRGESDEDSVIALDTGCVWGGWLTALKIPSLERVTVESDKSEVFAQVY